MRDDLISDLTPKHGEGIDPVELARRDLQKHLPKRFYKLASAEPTDGGFVLSLDGRPARTPAGSPLAVPTEALAQAIVAEWQTVGEYIDPGTMPVTRIVNSALDGVAREVEAVREEIVKYAGSDLLCYRAGDPQSLAAEQMASWDPVLDWVRDHWGARFTLAEGVMFVAQADTTLEAVRARVAEVPAPLRLAALNVMTTLTGSALLSLAVLHGRLSVDEAWAAAHVDEDHQIRNWGCDAEAMARRERRWREMQAAATVMALG